MFGNIYIAKSHFINFKFRKFEFLHARYFEISRDINNCKQFSESACSFKPDTFLYIFEYEIFRKIYTSRNYAQANVERLTCKEGRRNIKFFMKNCFLIRRRGRLLNLEHALVSSAAALFRRDSSIVKSLVTPIHSRDKFAGILLHTCEIF